MRNYLFDNNDDAFKYIAGALVALIIIGSLADYIGSDFNPPGTDTQTHYYGIPKSDPNRVVDYFDYKKMEYIYMDEKKDYGTVTPRNPVIIHRSKRHRLIDELIDEIKADIEMDLE